MPASQNSLIIRRVLKLTAEQKLLLFSGLVGLASGLAATGFYWMLNSFVQVFLITRPPSLNFSTVALIVFSPAVGGLICGILLQYFSPDARGGVAEVIDAILHRNGFIRPRVGFFKTVASAICIGSGGSAGREGPVVQIGASVGSTLAQLFRVARKHSQILVACGAAAGVAAVFNAPIAGAFFAAEIITGRFEMRDLTLLFTASALGAEVARVLLRDRATFDVPSYQLLSVWELGFHALLGVFCAFLAHLFILALHESEKRFAKIPLPFVLKPALGGLLVGLIGLWIPQVFGTGGDILESIFQNPTGPGLILLWLVAKLIATPLTLGSGGSGGDLMPSLFLGGTLGAAFGFGVHTAFPLSTMPPGAYALVGAAALFGGMAHAPMTAVILGFEMGHDYGVILPLMLACSTSALVSRRLRPGSLYTSKLMERGIDVERLRQHAHIPLETVRVSEVMATSFASVPSDTPLDQLSQRLSTEGRHGLLIFEQGKLVGIVTQSDLQKAIETRTPDSPARDIATLNPIVCFPSDTIEQALSRLGVLEVGQIPVVNESDPSQVIGLLSRPDILRGYSIGLKRTHRR